MNTLNKNITGKSILQTIMRFQSLFGLVAIFIIASIICVRNGRNLFLSPMNLANILRAISENGIIAIGMTLVILIGGIDLSVGAILGLTATVTADLLVHRGLSLPVMMLFVLILAAAFGAFNGIVHSKLRIQAFLVTLASMSIARGIARFWSGGIGIPIAYGTEEGYADPAFAIFGERIFGIPVPFICFLVIIIVFAVLMKFTRFGRYIYAIGGNETSAFLCGINVAKIKILVYTLAGVLAGFAGIIHAAQLSQGSPNDGTGYELNAITACAIGGTSMSGGKGTIIGTVIGALLIGVLDNMLGLKNIDANVQMVVKGFIIIIAVVLQQQNKK